MTAFVICVRSSLLSKTVDVTLDTLLVLEKTPDCARMARNWRDSRVLLADGTKFAQFASKYFFLFVYKRLT